MNGPGSRAGRHSAAAGSLAWLLLPAVVTLALFLPMFLRPGPLLCLDQPQWAAVAHELETEVVPRTGWFWGIVIPRANAGQPLGVRYSLNLVLLWALAQIASPALAVKLATLLSALAYASGLLAVARRLGPPLAAALGTSLGVVAAAPLMADGMWYNLLGLGLGLWTWVALARLAGEGRTGSWIASVLLLAATVYAHPLGVLVAGLAWAVLTVTVLRRRPPDRARLVAILAIPVLGLALAAPQVQAFFSGAGGAVTGWLREFPGPRVLGRVFCAHLLHPVAQAAVLAVAGLGVLGARRSGRCWILPLVPILLVAGLVVAEVPRLLPGGFPLRHGLVFYSARFEYVMETGIVLLLVLGTGVLLGWVRDERGRSRALAIFLLAGLFGIAAGQIVMSLKHAYRTQQTLGSVGNEAELLRLWDWLAENADPAEGRVHVEDTRWGYRIAPRADPTRPWTASHVLALTAPESGVAQVGGWAIFPSEFGGLYCSDGGRIFGLADAAPESPAEVDRALRRLDCRHLVVHSDRVRRRIAAMPFLRRVARIGAFDVYRHAAMEPGRAGPASDPTRRFPVEVRRGGLEYRIDAEGEEGETVLVSVAASSRWRARVGERELPVGSEHALVTVRLPASGRTRIRLSYEIEKTGALIALGAGLIGLLAGCRLLRGRLVDRIG